MAKGAALVTGGAAGKWYMKELDHLCLSNELRKSEVEFVQTDFAPINALLPFKMEEAAQLIEPYFIAQEAKKEPYILANITLHEAVKYFSIQLMYFISVESIIHHQTKKENLTVGLLGTAYTMRNDYWIKTFPYLDFIALPENTASAIDALRMIYFKGRDPKLALNEFQKLQNIKVDYWILACTELALALDDADIGLPIIHLPRLQCDYLCNEIKKN